MSRMIRSQQRLRHMNPRQRHQALLDAVHKSKPKGREALRNLIEAFDKTRDSDGIYHQTLVSIKPVYHPPVIANTSQDVAELVAQVFADNGDDELCSEAARLGLSMAEIGRVLVANKGSRLEANTLMNQLSSAFENQ